MSKERYHKILFLLVLVQIIGSLASILIWYVQPDMRMTLVVDYTEASIVAAVVAGLSIVALVGIRKKTMWAPLLVIIITISSRILGFLHFELSAGQVLFVVWSAVLIVISILNYLETPKKD
ncbi:hypothetical protein KJN74_00400 [Candidatus Bathyarchaeota archaeon]|nr:hypothetical protein [Candidatus Bathyarchaeota archaeon]